MEITKLILEFIKILAWPGTTLLILLIFRKPLLGLIPKLVKAELPGGVKFDFDEEIKKAEIISEKVKVAELKNPKGNGQISSINDVNARMIQLGLRPVQSGLDLNYYRAIADQDPNLALAGIRMEISILMENLLTGWKIEKSKHEPPSKMLRKLFENEAINSEQFDLANQVIEICNKAVHGQFVTRTDANKVIDIVEVLSEQYKAWLTWGFKEEDAQSKNGKTKSISSSAQKP